VHSIASDDTEITLGAGKLLGLFFLLAAICGIFFSIGYSLGKSSGREQALNDQPAQVSTAAEPSSSSEGKPSAAITAKSDSQQPAADENSTTNQPGNLTFYKAVQQSDNSGQTTNPTAEAAKAASAPSGPKVVSANAPGKTATSVPALVSASATRSPEVISHTSPVTGPGTLVVQIAAVSREDDAVALAGALRKKNYNVFVVNNPVTNDKFYHVQVGPFTTMAEAEAMKAKLMSEGYNPIIKK
jgi:DedD protein